MGGEASRVGAVGPEAAEHDVRPRESREGRPPGPVLVQRAIGWSDASKAGHAWNAGERLVGKIRRIPLEGLPVGLPAEKALKPVWDDKDKKWAFVVEPTKITALSPESATGKAIVLVPEALDATRKIEVLVFLHGHTEGTHRPFAGWRALVMPKPGDPNPLRQGIDAGDVAPVRDVALDQAPQQLEESKQTQTVIVLPPGGLHSQFGRGDGKVGGFDFDSASYVNEIVSRLFTERVWRDAKKQVAQKAPDVGRVTMAGHPLRWHSCAASARFVQDEKRRAGKGDHQMVRRAR
jgi:hypothetical protein